MTLSRKARIKAEERKYERTHRLYGWTALFIWLCFGMLLETAHGFKLSAYLLDALRREFWTLAHFHGVALALVNLIYVRFAEAQGLSRGQREWASRTLLWGSILMPIGFFLGGLVHYEGDPGIGIVLAPLGALLILVTAAIQTWGAWREA